MFQTPDYPGHAEDYARRARAEERERRKSIPRDQWIVLARQLNGGEYTICRGSADACQAFASRRHIEQGDIIYCGPAGNRPPLPSTDDNDTVDLAELGGEA